MKPDQLDLLPADQVTALLRKRRFWKRTMWISLILGVILTVAALSGTILSMTGAFARLEKSGQADPAGLARDISTAMLITIWSAPPACLAFLVSMVSFIRLLSRPKRDSGIGDASQR